MNAEASTQPDSITSVAAPEQLVAAREARGLSMSDVAAKLGMMPRQIAAIEQGRWEALPGQAFIRGAIRAYGKALQVDVAPLLATLGGQATPELRASASLDSPLPRYGALGFDHGGSGSRIVWILLGVIGVIAIAMYFGRGADLGQVLEPGMQSGRTVDVVPLSPDASSAGSDAGAAPEGSGGASSGSAATGMAGAAGSGALGGSGASDGIEAAGPTGALSPSTATTTSGSTPGSGIAPPAGTDTPAATAESAASPSGGDVSRAPSATPGAFLGETAPARSTGTADTSAAEGAGTTGAADATTQASASTTGAAGATNAPASTSGSADATNAPASTATEPSATQADSLVMRFERESWVEVRDATGRVLLLGTQPANSTREVSGEKPYSMTIGNAPFVRVEHGGRNVDLGNVTQKGVARLRVE